MCRTIHLSLDDLRGHLVEPPIVDVLHVDSSSGSFVVSFVPHDTVSPAQTETVVIGRDTPEGRRVAARLQQLRQLLGRGSVSRIVHGGGGNFTFHFDRQAPIELADEALSVDQTLQATDALRDLGQAAEIAFVIASRGN